MGGREYGVVTNLENRIQEIRRNKITESENIKRFAQCSVRHPARSKIMLKLLQKQFFFSYEYVRGIRQNIC